MSPTKKKLERTKERRAEVERQNYGFTISTNSLVFNDLEDGIYNDISNAYLLFARESEKIITGTFPQVAHQTTPVIVLETIDKVRSHKAVVISNSPTEITLTI